MRPFPVRTVIGPLEDHDRELVVAFGEPPDVDPELLFLVPEDPATMETALDGLELTRMARGLVFHCGPGWEKRDPDGLFKAQRRLLTDYFRNVHTPNTSPLAPDPLMMRRVKEDVPELVRMTSTLENIPYLLRYPLTDKLDAQRVGLPLLVLMPGPSLKRIREHLPALAERCLVACVSRSLDFCLKAGVEPDVLVQLDTYLVQRHFFDHAPKLPRTLLVALSITPMRTFAHLFRGVLFMDSFNPEIIPNLYRLRESNVSSLTACMGLAECLHSPRVYLAGSDLCDTDTQSGHSGGKAKAAPMVLGPNEIHMADAQGNPVVTRMRFLATADEADTFAKEIAGTTGTKFFNLYGTGILSREWFPPADPAEVIQQTPVLDRAAWMDQVDRALAEPENVNLLKLRVEYLKLTEVAREADQYLGWCVNEGKIEDGFRHPLARYAKHERDFRISDDPADQLAFGLNMVRRWKRALADARLVVQAHQLHSKGRKPDLLCEEQELESAPQRLAGLFPGGGFQPFWITLTKGLKTDWTETIPLPGLYQWLLNRELVLVTPLVMERYAYLFEAYAGGNVLCLKEAFKEAPEDRS